jgi:hypothetical protein
MNIFRKHPWIGRSIIILIGLALILGTILPYLTLL